MLYRRLLLLSLLLPACASDALDTTTTSPDRELDTIDLATRPASLLVADVHDAAARHRLEHTLAAVGGSILQTLPPRLVIAQVPDGAAAALADAGVIARFDRAVVDDDVPGVTADESRFLAVYANRWQAQGGPRIAATRVDRSPGEPFEAEPRFFGTGPAPDPEDGVSVPYASGTVVVSIVLPESNGSIDPSTENWNEDSIRAAYLKVQTAIDHLEAADPNANLHYVIHYQGITDTAYEFGQRAQWNDWANESLATADVLSHVLGHTVDQNDVWTAAMEYQLQLRKQYDADAAYFYIIAPNDNGTAYLRAHAYINGPWTVLDSSYGWETFMHETGHIFGALDEYCPDACSLPTSLAGYLGVANANAEYRESTDSGAGIDHGRGEAATSLMQYNDPFAVNGYTRGAWGWLDRDGDGIVDVRDTFPKSDLVATVTGQTVRLTGQVTDRPATALWRTPYSVNRIVGLDVELDRNGTIADTFTIDLPGDTRGRQAVDLDLPALPAGSWIVKVRGKNDVGNVEPVALALPVTIAGNVDTAPIAHLELPDGALGADAPVAVHADAVDLDGDATQVRIDLGGDGTWDTGWAAAQDLDVTPSPGLWAIVVQARDASGATSSLRREVDVFDGAAPPRPVLAALPGEVYGATRPQIAAAASAGDAELDWSAQLATHDGELHLESGWGAPATQSFELPTPERLIAQTIDLTAGDATLAGAQVRDVIALDAHTLAVAAGTRGVWFLDVTTPLAPYVISHVSLETIATRLWRDGSRLYVLGSMLTVIDIHDVAGAREVKQLAVTTGKRLAQAPDAQAIFEDPSFGAWAYLWMPEGEHITGTRVVVDIDHPAPSQLVITLYPPKDLGLHPIVLRDHVAGTAGPHHYVFTTGNTPALHALDGQFAGDSWQVEVKDDVLDGQTGTFVSSSLSFDTRSRAAPVIDDAAVIVGKTSHGALIVAGDGVEALDVTIPYWIGPVAKTSGTGSFAATMVGDVAIVGMPLESKHVKNPTLKGLVAIDYANASHPRVVRMETTLGVTVVEMAKIGSRLYLRMQPDNRADELPVYTSIADPAALASRAATWELARTPHRIDRRAFGDDRTVWTSGDTNSVTELDVSSPRDVRVLVTYPQSTCDAILPLGNAGDVLLFSGYGMAQVAHLGVVTSTLSRVYLIAVSARDAAGTIGRAFRTVHVIPYDHAPTALDVSLTGGISAGETFTFHVTPSDPDVGQIWDPTLLVRADWDGDGVFDSDWNLVPDQAGSTIDMQTTYMVPGTYHPVFEVRDGFFATADVTSTIVVQ